MLTWAMVWFLKGNRQVSDQEAILGILMTSIIADVTMVIFLIIGLTGGIG